MKAVYARVSTEEQVLKGNGIDNQIHECSKKAGTTDLLIYKDEGISGELIDRPGLNKLRADIRKGIITQLYIYDPDRLSRNLMNQLILDDEIRKSGVSLIFVNGEYENTPEGKMFFSFRGAIAEFEKSKIKERTSGGRREKARKGKVVKNSKLYGYTYNRDKSMYEINEEEAKIVRMIFDYFTSPDSPFKGINGIALHLTKRGVPTKRGAKQWHRQVVRQILMNESYTGTYYQNRYDTEGDYVAKQSGETVTQRIRPKEEWLETTIPAIITQEQFDYAQELLKQSRRRHTKESQHQYLLSGLVRCGKCGSTMPGRRRLSHGKDFYIYSGRKSYSGNTSNCRKEMSENKLNNIVWTHLVDVLKHPEKLEQFKEETNQTNYIQLELEMLEKEIEKTKKGRKRLIQLTAISEEDVDLDEILSEIRELQLKENELINQYTQLEQQIKENQESKPNKEVFYEAIKLYLREEDKSSFEVKRKLIQMMIKQVLVFDKDTVEIQLF